MQAGARMASGRRATSWKPRDNNIRTSLAAASSALHVLELRFRPQSVGAGCSLECSSFLGWR